MTPAKFAQSSWIFASNFSGVATAQMSYIPALPAEVADSVDVLISAISSSDEQAQLDALGHLASLIDAVSYTHLTLPTICSV